MLGFSMEELDVNIQFHEKAVVEGMFLFYLQKNHMSFGGPELHNELLKCANLIIVNCQKRRWANAKWCVIFVKLYNLGFLI